MTDDDLIDLQSPKDPESGSDESDPPPAQRWPVFSSFLKTKATAYCFLPSITALKFMSKLG